MNYIAPRDVYGPSGTIPAGTVMSILDWQEKLTINISIPQMIHDRALVPEDYLNWRPGKEEPEQRHEFESIWCICRGKPGEQFGGHVDGRYDICQFNGLWYWDGGTELMDSPPFEWARLPNR